MSAAESKPRAAGVELDNKARQLVIQWRDGSTSRLSLPALRRGCPCAHCVEERSRKPASPDGELRLLDSRSEAAATEAIKVERVGHYGVRITWADGHDYGIYSFAMLRGQGSTSAG